MPATGSTRYAESDRICVCVTTSTRERHSQQHGADRFCAVKVVLGLEFVGDGSPFGRAGIHSDKTSGHFLSERWVWQQIASQLPCDEVVKRKVLVERQHDPVAIWLNATFVIQMKPVRVSVANCIQPVTSLMFAEAGACQQLLDIVVVRAVAVAVQEGSKLVGCRRKSG